MQNKFFNPGGIVLCDSKSNKDNTLSQINKNLKKTFSGKVFVTRTKGKTGTYHSVSQILDPLDLAIIRMPIASLPDTLRECGEQQIRSAIILGTTSDRSVFTHRLKQKVAAISARYGMQIIGPRSAGCLDTHANINLSLFNMPARGHLALISESSARTKTILDHIKTTPYGISSLYTLGKRSGVTENELLLSLDQDKNTRAILLCLESLADPKNFFNLAKSILKRKAIILCPTGSIAGHKFLKSKNFEKATSLGIMTCTSLTEAKKALEELDSTLTRSPLHYRLGRLLHSIKKS